MITSLEQSVAVPRGDLNVAGRIRVAPKEEVATHVVKHSGGMPLRLILTESVSLPDLRTFTIVERGWRIEGLAVSVDGRYYTAEAAEAVTLASSTEVVEFGTPSPDQVRVRKPRTIEFRERTGAHG